MDGNEATLLIGAEIDALRGDLLGADPAKRAAATDAIARLQARRNRVITMDADAIGAEVDRLVGELEEIRTRHGLDAVSALGRTIGRLRDRNGAGNG